MNYDSLLAAITQVHEQAEAGAGGAVNRHLLLRNWLIGAYIVEFEQGGEDRAAYGAELLKRLSADLHQRAVGGCSPQMLERMRQFYLSYPQVAAAIPSPAVRNLTIAPIPNMLPIHSPAVIKPEQRMPTPLPVENLFQLSWTHIIDFIHIKDPWKRAFYENESLQGGWSKRQLQRQIGSLLYERTGLSSDKEAIIERARHQAAESPAHMVDLIRDPYVLEFTGLVDRPRYHESDLETALLDHLQAFLLELGAGFCFEARQKRITAGNEHDYLDLVFYHRLLRCHLLIDLKIRAFQHGDVGQMNFYLNYWKSEVTPEGDNPPVGLLLCSDKDAAKVEYATAGLDQRLFVSRYLVALPKPEELQEMIERDRAAWEERHVQEPR